MDDLKDHLATYLNNTREAMLWKVEGLSEREMTRPMVGSGTNILGLIQHLASVEYGYFVGCLGFTVDDGRYDALMADPEVSADMWVPADVPCAEILAFYRRAIDAANRNIEALPLDAPATVPWWAPEKRDTTLGRLLLHMNVETARHAGHADILRELIDGSTGLRRDITNMPPYDDSAWKELQANILRASESR
ncbi:DinB family protein [Paeniglutamicibacter sp. MACA_103]|uniref:DinB family protein n=1 Tax=Paeniglutamicibacter sp. MACA_103 TaxID=3377337 RepID=UPI003895883F